MSCSGGSGRFLSGARLVFIIAFIQEGFKPGNDQVFLKERKWLRLGLTLAKRKKGVPVRPAGNWLPCQRWAGSANRGW